MWVQVLDRLCPQVYRLRTTLDLLLSPDGPTAAPPFAHEESAPGEEDETRWEVGSTATTTSTTSTSVSLYQWGLKEARYATNPHSHSYVTDALNGCQIRHIASHCLNGLPVLCVGQGESCGDAALHGAVSQGPRARPRPLPPARPTGHGRRRHGKPNTHPPWLRDRAVVHSSKS
jgi:hypothetical protein